MKQNVIPHVIFKSLTFPPQLRTLATECTLLQSQDLF